MFFHSGVAQVQLRSGILILCLYVTARSVVDAEMRDRIQQLGNRPLGARYKCNHLPPKRAIGKNHDPHWVCLTCRTIPVFSYLCYSACQNINYRVNKQWCKYFKGYPKSECHICSVTPEETFLCWESETTYDGRYCQIIISCDSLFKLTSTPELLLSGLTCSMVLHIHLHSAEA